MSDVPPCTCNFTWEEMDAAASPWHRQGCPQGDYVPPPRLTRKERFIVWSIRKILRQLEKVVR